MILPDLPSSPQEDPEPSIPPVPEPELTVPDLSEESLAPAEETPIPELVFEAPPPDPDSRARRRRARRMGLPEDSSERARYLGELSHLAIPSFDFFLSALLCGITLGAALLTGSPALYVLAALLAPFMGPVVGLALGTNLGSLTFFFNSLFSLLLGGLLVFASGAVAGILFAPLGSGPAAAAQAALHARFTYPDLAVLVIGALMTAALAGRAPRTRPTVSSAALAYCSLLPLGAAGFGLFIPQGGGMAVGGWLVFAGHTVLAALIGSLVLCIMGARPLRAVGWLVGILLFALLAAGAAGLFLLSPGWQDPLPVQAAAPAPVEPTETPVPASSSTPRPTPALSETPQPTRTATATVAPTGTRTPTLAPSPTPVWGIVNAGQYNGAIIRPEPGSNDSVASLLNGALLQILPETVNRGGVIWLHVRTPDGKEGWVQATLIATATPPAR